MPTIYRSTDSSAPTLDGTAGSLITVLDACLVNGYTGKSAAGWTKPYSGTNKAVYRPGAGVLSSTGGVRYDDTGGQEASQHGGSSWSDVDTPTSPFPALATEAVVRKSASADSTTRSWMVAADDRTFYLFTMPGDTAGRFTSTMFGDFYTLISGDTSHAINIARNTAASTSVSLALDQAGGTSGSTTAAINALANALNASNPWSCNLLKLLSTLGSGAGFPNNPDGLVYLNRHLVNLPTTAGGVRGHLRGLYEMLNSSTGLADGDTWSGTGDFAGRTFLAIKPVGGSATRAYAIETSAWDTN